jgi:hypothetical protein
MVFLAKNIDIFFKKTIINNQSWKAVQDIKCPEADDRQT